MFGTKFWYIYFCDSQTKNVVLREVSNHFRKDMLTEIRWLSVRYLYTFSIIICLTAKASPINLQFLYSNLCCTKMLILAHIYAHHHRFRRHHHYFFAQNRSYIGMINQNHKKNTSYTHLLYSFTPPLSVSEKPVLSLLIMREHSIIVREQHVMYP